MAVIETQGFKLDNSGRRIVVDPITRIEGHLRIEVNVDDKNVIRNAVSTGTMWRGLEVILKGRDPRDAWAFVERICGVCTGVHALASVRAVEDALKIKIPDNANIIRNLMHATLYAQDHLVHFYHLHALDWVDVVSALKADPKKTSELAQSISSWPNVVAGLLPRPAEPAEEVRRVGPARAVPQRLLGPPGVQAAARGQPDGGGALPRGARLPEGDRQDPDHLRRQEPAPELAGGRRARARSTSKPPGRSGAINMERLNMVSKIIDDTIAFIDNVYIPDLLAIASFYKDWGAIGGGLSSQNLLAYGEFPDIANDDSNKSLLMPRGAIVGGNLKEIQPVDLKDPAQIQEFVSHSWYKYADETKGLHPFDGVTEPNFALGKGTKGTKTAIESLDESAKYSWVKSPRWRGHAMEVGPLARYVVGYAMGNAEFKEPVDMVLKKLDVPLPALFSTLGRTAARGLECSWAAHKMRYFFDKLMANLKAGNFATANVDSWEPVDLAGAGAGRGLLRGAARRARPLDQDQGHARSTTTSASCRPPGTPARATRKNQIGAYEAALMNTPMAKPDEPLEILRTIHSFDPCLACATPRDLAGGRRDHAGDRSAEPGRRRWPRTTASCSRSTSGRCRCASGTG